MMHKLQFIVTSIHPDMRTAAALIVILLLGTVHIQAQVPANDPSGQDLPRGFAGIDLGTSSEQVKEDLLQNPYFLYRGDPDVSLIPRERTPFIDSAGAGFVRRGMFQFHDDGLYTIILNLNENIIDFYTMYTTMTERYGEPLRLDPSHVVWEDAFTRISLERPLTVKYLDIESFESLRQAGQIEQSLRTLSRESFLEEF